MLAFRPSVQVLVDKKNCSYLFYGRIKLDNIFVGRPVEQTVEVTAVFFFIFTDTTQKLLQTMGADQNISASLLTGKQNGFCQIRKFPWLSTLQDSAESFVATF